MSPWEQWSDGGGDPANDAATGKVSSIRDYNDCPCGGQIRLVGPQVHECFNCGRRFQ